jgi:hypothetical protein
MSRKARVIGMLVALAVGGVVGYWATQESWSAEIILAVGALYVSIGGFIVAIWEIIRAATATEESTRAVDETLDEIARRRLETLLAHLRHATHSLEQANTYTDDVGAGRALDMWRDFAFDAEGALRRLFPDEHAVLSALQESIELGPNVKTKLREAQEQPLTPITANCLAAMERACNLLAPLLSGDVITMPRER